MLSAVEGVPQPYTYTGRELDIESGLYYYRARYYDPSSGRFLTEDPIGFTEEDQNLYRYVFNNPINLKDPFGFQGAATNPGAGAGDLPGAVNDILNGESDTRVTQDLFEALQDFSDTLEPGQQADVDVLVDPVTKEIRMFDHQESPGFRVMGQRDLVLFLGKVSLNSHLQDLIQIIVPYVIPVPAHKPKGWGCMSWML